MSKPKERPFNWFTPTHLRYAREGRYRDIPYLDRYYNSAMDRFVSKGGRGVQGANNKDLYRSNYASGRLKPPPGYMFDVEKAELVPQRRLRKSKEVFHEGLIYRNKHLMEEFLPTIRERAPPPQAAAGRYYIEAALYGRRNPGRQVPKEDTRSRLLSVFGRPVRRVGSHGSNDELMHGEQVVLRELDTASFEVSAADFAAFQRLPQENRLFILNDDDFEHFFAVMQKAGIYKSKSMFKVIKILAVSKSREEAPRSAREVEM